MGETWDRMNRKTQRPEKKKKAVLGRSDLRPSSPRGHLAGGMGKKARKGLKAPEKREISTQKG